MMTRLLRQDGYIARRSTLLWILCAAAFLICGMIRLDTDQELPVISGIGIVYAFIAADHCGSFGSSGRLDNQVIAGCPRPQIWLSSWLTLTFCCVLVLLFALGGDLAAGLLRNGVAESLTGWLICALGLILNAAAFAALYTLFGLLIAGRQASRGTVLLIVLTCVYLVFAIWGSYVDSALSEPETVPVFNLPPGVEVYVDDMDSMYVAGEMPNPDYVAEPARSKLMSLSRFLPVTQSTWYISFLYDGITSENAGIILQTFAYGFLLAAGGVAGGLLLFQQRELD